MDWGPLTRSLRPRALQRLRYVLIDAAILQAVPR
jgi:hypothetical protein